jgi:site-specific DNA-cytosine methylase
MAKEEWRDIITGYMGVEPIEINSSLVSAQNRVRMYWTNIPNITQPIDRGVDLQSILDNENEMNPAAIRGRYLNKATIVGRRLNSEGKREDYNNKIPITQCLEVRSSNVNKSNCLTTVAKDNVLTPLPPGRYPDPYGKKLQFRYYTINEMCRLQGVKEDYFKTSSPNQIRKMIGNGWNVPTIEHILSFLPELKKDT